MVLGLSLLSFYLPQFHWGLFKVEPRKGVHHLNTAIQPLYGVEITNSPQ